MSIVAVVLPTQNLSRSIRSLLPGSRIPLPALDHADQTCLSFWPYRLLYLFLCFGGASSLYIGICIIV